MNLANQTRPSIPESRFIARLIDPSKKVDYLIAFAIGALPIVIAVLVGAASSIPIPEGVTASVANNPETVSEYRGYLAAPNWWSLALLIPAVLFAFRWLLNKIVPVHSQWPPENEPPILKLTPNEPSKPAVYHSLRQRILSRSNLLATLALVTLITVLDMWPVVAPYFSTALPLVADWSSMFQLETIGDCDAQPCQISKAANSVLLVVAYFAQYTITFIGVIAIVILLRHNVFFIRNVYQRRRTSHTPANELFHIDVNDVNRCFGFRSANSAFNSQIIALIIGGLAMLLSRYANTAGISESTSVIGWKSLFAHFHFPVVGQWAMAALWLCALFIVAMPALVKLLPLLPSKQSDRIDASIRHYLLEFFPENHWPKDIHGNQESVQQVASSFAGNAFWPSGDNRARVLFFFSYWVFFIILAPPAISSLFVLLTSLVIYALVAYLATAATFKLMQLLLGYVDQQLITPLHGTYSPPTEHLSGHSGDKKKLDVGVFISYRRKDTVEYARSIHAELQNHFLQKRLFRDLAAIEPGENFVVAIDQSLDQVDNIIVLIGADWVSLVDGNGDLRLHKPEDMVRLEVATALKSGKRVIPVLVEGATMPSTSELPEDLHGLCLLNALEITDSRWEYDVGRLVDVLKTPSIQREGELTQEDLVST